MRDWPTQLYRIYLSISQEYLLLQIVQGHPQAYHRLGNLSPLELGSQQGSLRLLLDKRRWQSSPVHGEWTLMGRLGSLK